MQKEIKLDKNFIKKNLESLGRKYDNRMVFENFVTCCAFALSNSTIFNQDKENEYLKIVKKYTNEEMNSFVQMFVALQIELLKDKPEDALGEIYESSGFYNKYRGQFFTPLSVCDLMTYATFDKDSIEKCIKEKGYTSFSDPCCGSGRFLFSAVDLYRKENIDIDDVLFVASDISSICCYMTYINLSLRGVSAIVQVKDTLANKVYDTLFTPALVNNKNLINNLVKDGVLVEKNKDESKEGDYE